MNKTIHDQKFHELAMDYRGANPLNANPAYEELVKYIDQYVQDQVSAATKPTADLPDENECWVHIYPSDLKRMECTETHATVFSVAVGRAGEVSVPLYTAEQVQSLLATKPAAAPEGFVIVPINPTPAMNRAAVEYINGTGIYSSSLAPTVLEIEESIYHEVYRAMLAAAPASAGQAGAAMIEQYDGPWPTVEMTVAGKRMLEKQTSIEHIKKYSAGIANSIYEAMHAASPVGIAAQPAERAAAQKEEDNNA